MKILPEILKKSTITRDYILVKYKNRDFVDILFFDQSAQILINKTNQYPSLNDLIQINNTLKPNKIFGTHASALIIFDTLELCSEDKDDVPGYGCFERCHISDWKLELTGKCVKSCPPNYLANLMNKLCISIPTIPNCDIQRKSPVCLRCKSGYAKLNSNLLGLSFDTCIKSSLCLMEVWTINQNEG